MTGHVIAMCGLIITARITDVSLGTLRTMSLVQGRRWQAGLLGFVEILVWVFAVGTVLQNLHVPAYAVAYALGFAGGNVVGITIERALAHGEQVFRVFTREGPRMAETLRKEGYRLTEFEGRGLQGPLQMLFMEARRRDVPKLIRRVRQVDPKCFYVVDDIRTASSAVLGARQPTGWRAVLKKK